jgi:antitoxin CcdA|nr:type II toxin-antitoxin system CcdA family antitoxin [uncultured Undibacterium sp.]
MLPTYDENAAKKASNLSINSDLLRQAKALDINLSATLEAALKVKVKELQAQKWLQENQASITAYNESVGEEGVFSDGLRSF